MAEGTTNFVILSASEESVPRHWILRYTGGERILHFVQNDRLRSTPRSSLFGQTAQSGASRVTLFIGLASAR